MGKIKSFYPFFVFYAFTIISIIYTENLSEGIKYIVLGLPYIVFPVVFSTVEFKTTEMKHILKLYIFWLVILILYSEIITIYKLLDDGQSLYLIFRKDYSYIALGEIIGIHPPYMVLLLSFCVFYLIGNFENSGINKTATVFILALMLFYAVHLSSRLPLAVLCLVSFYMVFKKLMLRYSLLKTISIVLFLGLILSLMLYNIRATRYRFQELFGMQYANGVYIKSGVLKLEQWKSGIEANKNFLFGNGVGDAHASIMESNLKNGLLDYVERKYNAHNQYIQTYVGLGVFGFFMLLLLLYRGLLKNPNVLFKTASTAFLFYLAAVFMTESYLERHHGLVFICFMVCMVNFREQD